MAFQKAQNVNASGGSFTHVLGNQYNITANHTTAIHSALPVNDDGQVSVPIEFQYHGKPANTISSAVLLDVKTRLNDLNDEEAGMNEAVRIKLGVPADHYVGIELAQPKPGVHVTDNHSCYNAQTQSGLCISSTQTLAEYFKEYRSYHKFLEPKQSSSSRCRETDHQESCVEVGPASLKFHRTLRIPDDADEYLLPPGLGTFPLVPASKYSQTIPSSVKARGGFLMPMFQREAVWIEFYGKGKKKPCAIKISVGGINVITGLPRDTHPPNSCQDYIAYHMQPWLDGIRVAPDVVRQFVAMPLGHGYTIEEQVTGQGTGQGTGQANQGGIQIDVFPSLEESVRFRTGLQESDSDGNDLSLLHTPKDLGVHVGSQVEMTTLKSPPLSCLEDYMKQISGRPTLNAVAYRRTIQVFIKTRSSNLALNVTYRQTVLSLKCELEKMTGVLRQDQCLMYGSEALKDGLTLFDYRISDGSIIQLIPDLGGGGGQGRRLGGADICSSTDKTLLGIAAGGKILQRIYKDRLSADLYDEEEVQRLWIHVISSEGWETITGVVPPMSPIVPGTYEKYKYPWYKLYDENSAVISGTGNFIHVKSVHDVDNIRFAHPGLVSLNPDAPPPCTSHPKSKSVGVFRPCNHNPCAECLGMAMVHNSVCPICSAVILTFVGIKTPIAKMHAASGETEDKEWAVEQHIVGVRVADEDADNVITLFLAEDAVSGLRGSTSAE